MISFYVADGYIIGFIKYVLFLYGKFEVKLDFQNSHFDSNSNWVQNNYYMTQNENESKISRTFFSKISLKTALN